MIPTDGINIPATPVGLPPEQRKPKTAEEAAKQFEEVLLKQMLHTMTKELFDSNLSGEDGPQWMGAYSDMQSDILTKELAQQLAKTGKLGISELLIRQWKRQETEQTTLDTAGEVTPVKPAPVAVIPTEKSNE